jgi:hypothetical protein
MSLKTITAKKFISVNEASNLFNKSISTIRKIVELNKVIYKKDNNRVLIELESIEKVYNIDKKKIITNVSTNGNIEQNDTNFKDELIKTMKSEIENLKTDKIKLYEDIESRRVDQTQMQKLFENQQTLMLGLQQQMKNLTDSSTQNFPGKSKAKQSAVEVTPSDSPESSNNPSNLNVYSKSNEVPIDVKKTPVKRLKWWPF